MHPANYINNFPRKCAETGHSITETRETQINGVSLAYKTCKCGIVSRV